MYVGDQGVYSFTFPLEKNPQCTVCGNAFLDVKLNGEVTLQMLIDELISRKDM